jgi:hypothetical protein
MSLMSRSSQIEKLYKNGRLIYSQEEGVNVTMQENRRIFSTKDIDKLWYQKEIAYCFSEDVFYDPIQKRCYEKSGDKSFDPNLVYGKEWWHKLIFKFNDDSILNLDIYHKKQELEKPQQINKFDDIINLLRIDTMSVCTATNLSGPHPTVDWDQQYRCTFSVRSLVSPRCMFWNGTLDGHCSCNDAYDHAKGKTISLDRYKKLNNVPVISDESLTKNFSKARKISVEQLHALYSSGKLVMIHKDPNAKHQLFYSEELDILWNGYGDFLEELTIKKRKNNITLKELNRL